MVSILFGFVVHLTNQRVAVHPTQGLLINCGVSVYLAGSRGLLSKTAQDVEG